jgi:hypothetical protein
MMRMRWGGCEAGGVDDLGGVDGEQVGKHRASLCGDRLACGAVSGEAGDVTVHGSPQPGLGVIFRADRPERHGCVSCGESYRRCEGKWQFWVEELCEFVHCYRIPMEEVDENDPGNELRHYDGSPGAG